VACSYYWQFWSAYGTPFHVVFGAQQKLSSIEKQRTQRVRDSARLSLLACSPTVEEFQIVGALDTPAAS